MCQENICLLGTAVCTPALCPVLQTALGSKVPKKLKGAFQKKTIKIINLSLITNLSPAIIYNQLKAVGYADP